MGVAGIGEGRAMDRSFMAGMIGMGWREQCREKDGMGDGSAGDKIGIARKHEAE